MGVLLTGQGTGDVQRKVNTGKNDGQVRAPLAMQRAVEMFVIQLLLNVTIDYWSAVIS